MPYGPYPIRRLRLTCQFAFEESRLIQVVSYIAINQELRILGGDPLEPPMAFGSVIYGTFEE
jgi:hypothetical protein